MTSRPQRGRRWADGPRPVGQAMERLLGHMDAPTPSVIDSVFTRWPELVGEVIGTHTRPIRIVDAVLHIEVADPAWVSELSWMADELVRRIRDTLDTDEIRAIEVQLAR